MLKAEELTYKIRGAIFEVSRGKFQMQPQFICCVELPFKGFTLIELLVVLLCLVYWLGWRYRV